MQGEADGDGELVEILSLLAVSSRTPSRSVARMEAMQAVQTAMDALDEDYRTALRLRYIDGLAMNDVARGMGRSEGAVAMLCQRGLARLRDTLGDPANFLSRKG